MTLWKHLKEVANSFLDALHPGKGIFTSRSPNPDLSELYFSRGYNHFRNRKTLINNLLLEKSDAALHTKPEKFCDATDIGDSIRFVVEDNSFDYCCTEPRIRAVHCFCSLSRWIWHQKFSVERRSDNPHVDQLEREKKPPVRANFRKVRCFPPSCAGVGFWRRGAWRGDRCHLARGGRCRRLRTRTRSSHMRWPRGQSTATPPRSRTARLPAT